MDLVKQQTTEQATEEVVAVHEFDHYAFVITKKPIFRYSGEMRYLDYSGFVYDYDSKKIIYGAFLHSVMIMTEQEGKYPVPNQRMRHICLCEIQAPAGWHRRGMGSLMLKHLQAFAKRLGVYYISGKMSPVDVGILGQETPEQQAKRKRLTAFYQKNGFSVDGYDLFLPLRPEAEKERALYQSRGECQEKTEAE